MTALTNKYNATGTLREKVHNGYDISLFAKPFLSGLYESSATAKILVNTREDFLKDFLPKLMVKSRFTT